MLSNSPLKTMILQPCGHSTRSLGPSPEVELSARVEELQAELHQRRQEEETWAALVQEIKERHPVGG